MVLATGCGDEGADTTTGGTTSSSATPSPTTAPPGAGSAPGVAALDGRTFVSTAVTGHDLVPGTTIRISVDGTRLGASAGCNTMSAEVVVEGDTLRWSSQPASTLMGCEPELMAQDEWLVALLTAGVTYTLDGDALTLVGDGVQIELSAEPQAPLTGTTWVLDGILTPERQAVSGLPAGVTPPTLEISEDGSVSFTTGCNTGTTTVEVTGTALVFAPPAVTKIACDEPAAGVEAVVLAVLEGPVDVTNDGTTLTLGKAAQGLVYRAAP